jgi:DNA-directed RNA polymerase subunit RPC12/RpoP
MFKSKDFLSFQQQFKTTEDCLKYLEELKWNGGYKCNRCGFTGFYKGRKALHRRCKKCQYNDSITSNTIFHKIKFDLLKAFYIVYRITTKKKGLSTIELASEFGLQQKTCWLFKRKIQEAMRSQDSSLLTGDIDVDETAIGGKERGIHTRGRSNLAVRKKVILAIERVQKKNGKPGIGRAYAQTIDAQSADDFRPFFDAKIDKKAKITTDKWTGYIPLMEDFNIKTKYSNEGQNFQKLHVHILNLKNWIRGTHHHVSTNHIQAYLDEFHYRFNRRNMIENIFENLMKRMINGTPFFVKDLAFAN